MQSNARLVPAGLFAGWIALMMVWCNHGRPASDLYAFGWEYGNIAAGLAAGHGFADLVAPGSGPTAWMPPLLPALYALVFLAAGCKTVAAAVLIGAVRALAGGACLFLLQGWCRSAGQKRAALVMAVFYLSVDHERSFCDLNDPWLINLCCCLTVDILLHELTRWRALAAFLLPLASPPCALALAVGLGLRRRRGDAVLFLLMVAAAGGWGLRNQWILGQFYPIKSNFWFDFVEANLEDEDGLLTVSLVDRFHPVKPNRSRQRYLELGEREFLREVERRAPLVTWSVWRDKTLCRLRNATWRLQSENDVFPAAGLATTDGPLLAGADLLQDSSAGPVWLYLYRNPGEVRATVDGLALEDRARVMASRLQAEESFTHIQSRWDFVLWSYLFTVPPALAGLYLVVQNRRENRPAMVCLGVYWLYLTPYLLVQHYARYQVSTLYLQVFLLLSVGDLIGRRWRRANQGVDYSGRGLFCTLPSRNT